MFLRDFSGNALEFKAFRHPEHVPKRAFVGIPLPYLQVPLR
jgi:hypothetical protein